MAKVLEIFREFVGVRPSHWLATLVFTFGFVLLSADLIVGDRWPGQIGLWPSLLGMFCLIVGFGMCVYSKHGQPLLLAALPCAILVLLLVGVAYLLDRISHIFLARRQCDNDAKTSQPR